MLNGIDVSKWQLEMDWAKAKTSGVQFAIVRAGSIDDTTGICYEDSQYRNNIAGLNAQKIPYALYWYFRPKHPVGKQYEFFLNLAKEATLGQLRVDLYCDIEIAGDAAKVKAFCEVLSKSYPVGIYTNLNTVKYLLTGDKSWMAAYSLWLADYTPPYPPPDPWKDWAILQYSSTGDAKKYGSPAKSIDLDYAVDWMVAPPPPPVPVDYELRIKALEVLTAQHDVQFPLIAGALINFTDRFAAVEERITILEDDEAAPKTNLTVTSRAVARITKKDNEAGKPIMVIKEPRVIFTIGTKLLVDPKVIDADSSTDYYKVLSQPGELYIRVQDGTLT